MGVVGTPRTLRVRVLVVALVLGGCFAGVAVRLVSLMVIQHEELARRAERQHQKIVSLQARRGSIYDRHGRELAVSIETDSLYAVPARIENPRAVAARLAPVLGLNRSWLYRRLDNKRGFVWIQRKLDPERVHRVQALGLGHRVIGFLPEHRRFYPKRELAAHVLGFAGTDNVGLEGLERQYDRFLRGESGWVVTERDALGRTVFPEGLNYRAPSPGASLVLTLDETVQYMAERALDRVMAETRAKSSVAIVMDPYTGEILAMAVRPRFNPNAFQRHRPGEWRNRAITDAFEPGSTLKVFVAAAALEEGLVHPRERLDCSTGRIEVGGKAIRDTHPHGVLTFTEVLQKSSNVGAVIVGLRLGPERMYRYLKAFGFGDKTGIDLPGEVSGTLRRPERWSALSIGALSIGQEISVTPLQLITAFSAIANGGVLMRPYVVREIRDLEGRVVQRFGPQRVRRVISQATARRMTRILMTVVAPEGTGHRAALEDLKVAGKTGTAQKVDPATGRYSDTRSVSSFAGYVPAEDPRVAILVMVDEPQGEAWGGSVAAPVFREIAEQVLTYLNVPPEDSERTLIVARQ